MSLRILIHRAFPEGGAMLGALLAGLIALASTAMAADPSVAAPPAPTVAASQPAAAATQPACSQPATEETVRRFIEASDRYLHHGRLVPGMTGYGLTVMQGNRIVRFDVQIISVMRNWGPRQDVILAKLTGQGLDKTGPVQGMSGSPIYVRDERDGRDKLIGAMAYGWELQKECLVGIQPIANMLAIEGYLGGGASAQLVDRPGGLGPEALAILLGPRQRDFLSLVGPASRAKALSGGPAQLRPLATPLMASGLSPAAREELSRLLEPTSLSLVTGGGGSAPQWATTQPVAMEPGASMAVPLVEGDMDFSAVGAVTDVIGDRVIGFGHAFEGEGQVCLPMSPAYIHTVVSNLMTSFKLGSPMACVGALTRDDQTGVGGVVGRSAQMIPMNVEVVREDGQPQHFAYRLAQHRWLTALLSEIAALSSATAMSDLPQDHTVRYQIQIDFEGMDSLRADNVASQHGVWPVLSDLVRPLVVMMNCPFGPPAKVRGIDVRIQVADQSRAARILDLTLDGRVYQPGQTVTGQLRLQPYRQAITTLAVSFELPADLPDDTYRLTASDAQTSLQLERLRMPQRFTPRSTPELLAMVQAALGRREDTLYLHLPTERGGIAIGQRELTDLPPSRRTILTQQARQDVKEFQTALERPQPTCYVLSGSAVASFTVSRTPREIPVQGR